jgi:hypothetical protein
MHGRWKILKYCNGVLYVLKKTSVTFAKTTIKTQAGIQLQLIAVIWLPVRRVSWQVLHRNAFCHVWFKVQAL